MVNFLSCAQSGGPRGSTATQQQRPQETEAAGSRAATAATKMSIAPVSQFFILSPRGDTIISKDYRGDAVAGTTDTFFRKASQNTTFVRIVCVGGEINILLAMQRSCRQCYISRQQACLPAVALATPTCNARWQWRPATAADEVVPG